MVRLERSQKFRTETGVGVIVSPIVISVKTFNGSEESYFIQLQYQPINWDVLGTQKTVVIYANGWEQYTTIFSVRTPVQTVIGSKDGYLVIN